MKIEVNKNYVKFNTNEKVNKKEFKATPLEFTFSKEYESLTCKAIFSKIPKTSDEDVTFYQQAIIDGKCFIPYEVLDGEVEGILIGVYGYEVEDNELKVRYSPEPKNLWLLEGSYYEGASTPEEITPSQFEQYTSYLNSQIERLNRINIETTELPDGVKISVTNADGETTETEVYNGEKGEKGDRGEPGLPGTNDYDDLTNKPSINGTTLEGDVSLEDIGIGSVFTIKGSVSTPNDLPLTGNSIGDVYYVESVMAGYVWIEVSGTERWEELGEPIDLSEYYTKDETDSLLDDKQDTLTAGSGIDITNNVISATSGDSQTSFVFTYGEASATSIETAQKVIDYYKTYNVMPLIYYRTTTNTSYGGYNMLYNLTLQGYSNRVYKFSVYKLQSPEDQYTGAGYVYFIGILRITMTQDETTVSSVSIPEGTYSGSNRAYRSYEIPILYKQCSNNQSANSYVDAKSVLPISNSQSFTPTGDYNPATKKYVDDKPTTYSGYDTTKTQILKNINGTLTWVDEV